MSVCCAAPASCSSAPAGPFCCNRVSVSSSAVLPRVLLSRGAAAGEDELLIAAGALHAAEHAEREDRLALVGGQAGACKRFGKRCGERAQPPAKFVAVADYVQPLAGAERHQCPSEPIVTMRTRIHRRSSDVGQDDLRQLQVALVVNDPVGISLPPEWRFESQRDLMLGKRRDGSDE